MLSDISSVFSHFIVNPNYYTSFIFGYKRQDLFNEINKIKSVKNKDIFEEQFPADFIAEGIDQRGGWFYTLLVISTFLTGKSPF